MKVNSFQDREYHTELEASTARKKVQAMRLHPSSNFPISGLKLIEKQIF